MQKENAHLKLLEEAGQWAEKDKINKESATKNKKHIQVDNSVSGKYFIFHYHMHTITIYIPIYLDTVGQILKEEFNEMIQDDNKKAKKKKRRGKKGWDNNEYDVKWLFLITIVAETRLECDASTESVKSGPMKFVVGDKVRNIYNLRGKVSAVHEDSRTYDVVYNDGRNDFNIHECDILPTPTGKQQFFKVYSNIL